MTNTDTLSTGNTSLLAIDIQERLFPFLENGTHVAAMMRKAILGFQALKVPIVTTVQVPEKMGEMLPQLKNCFGDEQRYLDKSSFSCLEDSAINAYLESLPQRQWVLMGIETHICVLQTARDLLVAGKHVTVLSNACTSRHFEDHISALDELRHWGLRVSTVETVLFELLGGANAAEFRQIRDLVK